MASETLMQFNISSTWSFYIWHIQLLIGEKNLQCRPPQFQNSLPSLNLGSGWLRAFAIKVKELRCQAGWVEPEAPSATKCVHTQDSRRLCATLSCHGCNFKPNCVQLCPSQCMQPRVIMYHLCTTEYVCTPPGQWGQCLQPDDCIFLETRAERTDLADCGRFPQISNFSGADRRKQNICRRDFAEEERHLPHFKYLICCFSRCSHFQHWFKVKAYSK